MNNYRPNLSPGVLPQNRIAEAAQLIIGVILIGLLGVGIAEFIQRFFPAQPTGFVPVTMVLLAVIALYTHVITSRLEGSEKTIFRVSEIVSLLVLIRIMLFVRFDLANLEALQRAFALDPMAAIANTRFAVAVMTGFSAWLISTYQASLYAQTRERAQDVEWEDLGKVHNSLKNLRTRLVGVSAAMLIMLVTMVTLIQVPITIPNLFSTGAGPRTAIWLIMAFGILMLAQMNLSQLLVLHTRWHIDRALVSTSVTKHWFYYAIILFMVVGIVAALMPTRYSIGFFDMIGWLLNLIYVVVSFILYGLSLPFMLLMRLLSSNREGPQVAPALPQIQPFQPTEPTAAPVPFWEILKTVLLWGTLAIIIIFSLYQFITANKTLVTGAKSSRVKKWLADFIAWIRSIFTGLRQIIQDQIHQIQEKNKQKSKSRSEKMEMIRKSRDSRDRIVQIYMDLLEFAGIRGLSRKESQTPSQYNQFLAGQLPQVEEQVTDITRIFTEARYSTHIVEDSDVQTITTEADQVKKAFPNET